MARHRLLAAVAIVSGLANLGLSLLLVRSLGLAGVALGTLIPYTVECLGFILPYALHNLGIRLGEALREVFLPPLLPAIPMAIVLYVLREAVRPASLLAVVVVGGLGVLVYLIAYLGLGATSDERRLCRMFALNTLRLAKARLTRS